MGTSQFLPTIKDKQITIDQSLLNCSSSKLRQYYSSYKSICESFSITISQFIQIFGHNQKAFQAFDPKKKGRIDAIQMFTGLIIFSAVNYQQKIKFLFQIFDFNQQGWLSYEAVTFLIINGCNATYKIFSIPQTINSKQIESFLNEYFYQQSQIGLEKFIKWSRKIQQFMNFFNIIEQEFQPYYEMKKIDKIKSQIARQKCYYYKRLRNIQYISNLQNQNTQTGNFPITLGKDNNQFRQLNINQTNLSRKTINNTIFDNDYSRVKSKDHQKMLLSSPGHNNNNKTLLQDQIQQTKSTKKIKKSKYKINFQFDNKFIDILSTLVTPEQQRYVNRQNQNGIQNINKERVLNDREVNFYLQNCGTIGEINQQNGDDDEFTQQEEVQQQKFNPSLKWLYGINVSIPNPIQFIQTTDPKASNQIFIYTLNHIVILFYPKINIQQHYTQHKNKISAFQISKNKNYVVSADYGEDYQLEFPQIHVWRVKDRRAVVKWKHIHKGKIKKLAWTRQDRNIVAISLYENKWAVKIIDVISQNILLSTYIMMDPMYSNISDNFNTLSSVQSCIQNEGCMINIIECNKTIQLVNNQTTLRKCLLVYTSSSVTYLIPNYQQEQSISINSNKQQQNITDDKKIEYSVVTKYLNQQGLYSLNNNFNNTNNKPLSSTINNNRWSQMSGDNKQSSTNNKSSIVQILQYGNDLFLCVHNDRKIRLWDGEFQTYEVVYTRDMAQKAMMNIILIDMEDNNSVNDTNVRQNVNQNTMLSSKNKKFINTNKQSMMKMSLSSSKKGDTMMLTKFTTTKKSSYNQQDKLFTQSNTKNKLLVILDQQKLQLMSLQNNRSLHLTIPQSLYNLMLIDMQLIITKKAQRELLVVSLFGDVIRVVGLENVLENFNRSNNEEINKNDRIERDSQKMNVKQNKAKYTMSNTGKIRHGLSLQQQQQQSQQQQHYYTQQHQQIQPITKSIPISQLQKLITYRKYYQLFTLQKCKDYHSHQQHDIILAKNLLYKINSDQRQLVTLISFDYQLKAISAHNSIYAILTENDSRYIYLLVDEIIVEKIKLVHQVTTFKLIHSHLILCSQKFIEVYTKSYDKYFSQQSRKIQIDSSPPVDISTTQNPYKFLITTQDRQLYYLQIKNYDFKYKKIKSPTINVTGGNNTYSTGGHHQYTNSNINSTNVTTNMMMTESYLQIMYPHVMDCFCMVFYPQQRFVCLGLTNGQVRVWDGVRRLHQSKQLNQQYYQLTSHYGPVQRMKLRFFLQTVQLITLGREDGMVIVYGHKQYLIGDKDKHIQTSNNLSNEQALIKLQNNLALTNYLNEITMFNTLNNKQTPGYNQDTLAYSIGMLKDSQLQVSLFEDTLPTWVQKIITNIVHPSTSNYEPLTSQYQHTRANLISLQISHIYGLFSQKTRNTTAYIHHYPQSKLETEKFQDIIEAVEEKDINKSNREKKSLTKQQPKINKLSFSENKLLPLNEQHENCKRQIIYFIDRLIVLVSPQSKKQRVYSFHTSQVTSFQVHPNKRIVCSAQRAISQPVIHIWDAETLVLIKSIKTKHKSGSIYKVQFSRQGTYVMTLSGCSENNNNTSNQYERNSYISSNKNFNTILGNTGGSMMYNMGDNNINNFTLPQIDYISLEIIQWRYSNSVLYKVLFNEQIFAVKFNPYCETEICLGGRDSLKIYAFQLGNLVTKQTLTQFNQTITSLTYSSALYGNDIESDIILGTIQGNILLYICGKLITVKKIHQSSINFISLNEIFKYKTIVVTGSEDGMVKVWDMKFNLLTKLNIKDQLLIGKNVQQYNAYSFSPQSVDLYSFYSSKQTQSSNSYILLISTRSGCIIQSKLTNQYQGLKSIQNQKVTVMKQKLSLQTRVIVRNNSFINEQGDFQLIGQKVMVTYSIGSSVVVLWNIEKNQYLSYLLLKHCPSVIKYSPTMNKIFIGYFKTSDIDVYILKDNSLQYFETFSVKSDYYPDNIAFCSTNNNLLAVSLVLNTHMTEYNNNTVTNNMSALTSPVGTCIEVYEYKQVWKGSGNMMGLTNMERGSNLNVNKKEYEMKYRIDHSRKRGVSINPMGSGTVLGSVWMEFSATGQELLVLYSQKKVINNYNFALINNNYNYNRLATKDNQYFPISSLSPNTQHSQHLYTIQHSQKHSKSSQFILYNLIQKKQKQPQQLQQFIELNFYPFVKVNYLYHEKTLNNNGLNTQMKEKVIGQQGDLLHPMVSQMAQYHKYIVIGTTMGELIFVHSDFFCVMHRKSYKPTQLYKYFKLFSSPITKIITFSDRIIVSSGRNNSIINIKVIDNEQISIFVDLKDQYNEKITEQYLQKLLKLTFPKRKYIYQSRFSHSDKQNETENSKRSSQQKRISKMKNIKTYKQTQISSTYQIQINSNQLTKKRISLQLQSVIGRNAMYKRNNIFIDLRENIISHTGCNLVILKRNTSTLSPQQQVAYLNKPKEKGSLGQQKRTTYTQQFLKLDMTPFSTFAEISTLTISQDRRLIFAGTNQENAKILIWDISTRTHIKQISLRDMISIRKIGVSSSNSYLAVIAMNKKGQNILFFIDMYEENILAAFTFSPQHSQINDVKFFPELEFVFLLCGNNYMAQWRYNGQLTFQHYNIDNPSDFIDTKEKTMNTMKSQSHVIFYSLAFLKDILISAGSDGYLYIWNEKRIIKKQNAHPKSAILCLYASSSSRILASGGADGKAIVWQLSSSSIIQKIFEFSIYHGREQKIPIRYHIQSVCISKNNIIVGTRSGEVYEFLCNDIEQIQKLKQQWKKGINLILPAFDDDTINSISFNTSSQKLFMITQSGCFSVFDLATMQKVRQQKIDIGKSQIIKMVVCKLSYRIFIILKNSVISYYYMYNKQQKVQKFRKGKEILKVQQMQFIKNAIMSSNEKYLALLMASAQMDLYSIQLYDLSQPQGQFFKQYKILDHIPTNVTVIDFSTDNQYLICKNTQDQQTIIHLSTHEIINPNSIQFQLQYSDEAKKTSKYIRDVLQLYGQENQLLKIAQVMNHSIIAADQMGSIRVFEYPIIAGSNKDKQDISYYRFYVEHLNEVYLCVLSQDSRLLATVGREDRSLFLWKVKQT